MNLNLNLGAGALDIPIARKLDISDASERSLQAPVRPAQAPGRARPAAWAGPPRKPGGPPRVRSGPSERCISPLWTGGTMERRQSGWSAGIRMERWNPDGALGERDGTMALLLAPGSPDRPSGCRSGPLGQPSGVGQPTRSLRRIARVQKTRNTRLHTNSSHA